MDIRILDGRNYVHNSSWVGPSFLLYLNKHFIRLLLQYKNRSLYLEVTSAGVVPFYLYLISTWPCAL